MSVIPTLESQRLALRPFAASDADAVQKQVSVPEIARTVANIPYPYPDGLAAAWIATHEDAAANGASLTWAITERATGSVIGAIHLGLAIEHARGDLGYWVGMPYWGQGYATEAARLVIVYGYSALDLHRIQAFCLPSNVGSIRVVEKLGFRSEGTLRGYVRKWGNFEDRQVFGLLRDSWIHESQPDVTPLTGERRTER